MVGGLMIGGCASGELLLDRQLAMPILDAPASRIGFAGVRRGKAINGCP
jgi:hypothetical protein